MQLPNLLLRALQFIWTLLILALTGNIIANAFAGNPSIINYDMFVAVFSMLSLLYLIPATIKESFIIHPIIMLALDVINTLLFFIAGVAMAAKLGVRSCSDEGYLKDNTIVNGSLNSTKRCRESQAITAFFWFGFAAYLGSAILSALTRGGSAGITRGGLGGVRRGAPTMSQV